MKATVRDKEIVEATLDHPALSDPRELRQSASSVPGGLSKPESGRKGKSRERSADKRDSHARAQARQQVC